MEDTRHVPIALNLFMKARGLSVPEVRSRTGMSQGQLSGYLKKPVNMQLNTLRRLLRALDVSLADFTAVLHVLERLDTQRRLPLPALGERPPASDAVPPEVFRLAGEVQWLHRQLQEMVSRAAYGARHEFHDV